LLAVVKLLPRLINYAAAVEAPIIWAEDLHGGIILLAVVVEFSF
jgi:hypothetical protein